MKRLVEFPTDDGGIIVVEVDEPGHGGTLRSGRGGDDLAERAKVRYEEALNNVQPAAVGVIKQVRALPDPPDEVSLELGIKLNSEMGAIIASASAEAHFVLKLTWRRKTTST